MPDLSALRGGGVKALGPVAVVGAALFAARPVSDPSPWLHLRVGQFLAGGGRFSATDPWAPLAAHTYVPTQWLPSVVVDALYDRFGLDAVVWARMVGIALLVAVVLVTARQVAGRVAALATTAAVVAASWPALSERPQLLGFVLLVPIIAGWVATGHDRRARWWLVPLTWLCACTHGIWSLGLVVGALVVGSLATEAVVTTWRAAKAAAQAGEQPPTGSTGTGRLALVWLACLAAAAATPLGPKLVLTPFTVGSNGRSFVDEWLPTSVRQPHVLVALAMVVGLAGLWVAREHRPRLWEVVLLVAALGLIMSMQRTVPVGAFVVAPMLARELDLRWSPAQGKAGMPVRERLAVLAAVVLAAALAVPVAAATSVGPQYVPTGVQPALDALAPGTRLIAEGDVTGWLLFAAPNTDPVFDLRIESYDPVYVRHFIEAMDAQQGWDGFVRSTGAQAALLTDDSPLALALQDVWHWRVVQHDRGFVLLEAA
ncbi:hypothetical protein SAMN04489867_1886 [Pedococcus dokdonensis]|uniref:Dolichyl-phosphate-mannose-protein mannosyltransferase n=1 Tax=Pedococcus dokdonensis TaxID=443156 RepID=A0A1H0R9C9_9MICO|nr:hypothetical protein [Pedococcus dokdonensis]SDP26104.1 hypothetical protein SAMN04489867_1886 [Pedococcus dokdonensis]